MEPAPTDRIQRMIDAEAAERFPPGAVPQLALLHHGDHPLIEPGELYLRVFPGQDGATRDAWMNEHFRCLKDFRAQRLPEVKGFIVTADAPGSARTSPHSDQEDGRHLPARPGTGRDRARPYPGDGQARARGPGDAGRADHRGHRGQPRGGRALGCGPHPRAAGLRPAQRAGGGARRASAAGSSPGPGRAGPAATQAR